MLKTISSSLLILIVQLSLFAGELKTTPETKHDHIQRKHTIFINTGGGINFARGSIAGNGDRQKKHGFAFHFLVEHQYMLHKYFAYGSDLGFYKKTFAVSRTYNTSEINYNVNLNQLSLAPKFIYIYKYIYIGAGLFINYNISDSQSSDSEQSFNPPYKIKTFEYGLLNIVGFRYLMQNNLVHRFGFRLSYGFNKIYKNHLDDKINNLSTELEYSIGHKF